MTAGCRQLQEIVAEHGAAALKADAAGQAHLADCGDCLGFVEALLLVDGALETLPTCEPSAALEARTLDALTGDGDATQLDEPVHLLPELTVRVPDLPAVMPPIAARQPSRVRWARVAVVGALAAAALVVVSVATDTDRAQEQRAADDGERASFYDGAARGRKGASNAPAKSPRAGDAEATTETPGYDDGIAQDEDDNRRNAAPSDPGSFHFRAPEPEPELDLEKESLGDKGRRVARGISGPRGPTVVGGTVTRDTTVVADGKMIAGKSDASGVAYGGFAGTPRMELQTKPGAYTIVTTPVVVDQPTASAPTPDPATVKVVVNGKGEAKKRAKGNKDKAEESGRREKNLELAKRSGVLGEYRYKQAGQAGGFDAVFSTGIKSGGEVERETLRQFLNERDATEGLAFVSATGYWANTYVPGDPVLRLLHARAGDRTPLAAQYRALALHRAARPYAQSFDAPKTSAVGLSVRADRRSADGPTRMLVQVGLEGTARQAGRRPAMNIGVVLHLSGDVSADDQASVRALLSALRIAKQTGDRISLTVAGRPGGLVLTPGQFKHGPLTVTQGKLFGDGAAFSGPTLTVTDAVARASQEVLGSDDPTAPLGSSIILLVTTSPLRVGELSGLAATAHQNAVNGVGMSVVGVGDSIDVDQITELAAAGQGNRRLLRRAADAKALVGRELSAVGAVVARALRVRIRLAPGVKLVGVIGSRRLDAAGADRARETERSIDARTARARGIKADRGEDEDGIQIIIPSFYASDSHVILLDVVADGPGAVADVTVRYKDLVFLRNGVARGALALRRGNTTAGKTSRSVLKNFVAQRISVGLRTAGDLVAAGQTAQAAAQIQHLATIVSGVTASVPELAKDSELSGDAAMLAEYLSLLIGGGLTPDGFAYVADSLRYAGWRKLVLVRDEAP